jgi:predicted transcriptional regulator
MSQDEMRRKVLLLLSESHKRGVTYAKCSPTEIEQETGIPEPEAGKILQMLIDSGELKQRGFGAYELTDVGWDIAESLRKTEP